MKSKENKKIKNATSCESNGIKFKSQLEKVCYSTLSQLGFNPLYEPITFQLWPSFEPIIPFYDQETKKQQEKRLSLGKDIKIKSKKLILKKNKIIGIKYTPDFFIKYKNINVYIECKGVENDTFYLKKKLFRKYLDEQFVKNGTHSIYFEIYTKKQILQAVEIFKCYAEEVK